MITQTITLTKNNGTTYSIPAEALGDLESICSDQINLNIQAFTYPEQYEQDGLLETNRVLNDAKTGIIITRKWDDDSWNAYYNFIKDLNFNTIFRTNYSDGWRLNVTTDTDISYSSE